MKVSKQQIIKVMSDRARSLAKQLEKHMTLKSVEVDNKKWERKK